MGFAKPIEQYLFGNQIHVFMYLKDIIRGDKLMKIAIFIADSNGGYPVPAVKGGAVSTLVEHLVEKNNERQLAEMTVVLYSVYRK